MRAFVAVDLPQSLRQNLEVVQEGLPGRHVSGENLHLTLAFLGDVDAGRVQALAEALEGLRLDAPMLRVSGLDLFGGKRPNLCFAAIETNEELSSARRILMRVCRQVGIDLRRERFRPHVTLSRFGRELGAREEERLAGRLGVIRLPEARAERFSLYRSELRPEGPVYRILAQFDFD